MLPVPSPVRFVTFEIAPFVMLSAPLTVRLVPTLMAPVELTVAPWTVPDAVVMLPVADEILPLFVVTTPEPTTVTPAVPVAENPPPLFIVMPVIPVWAPAHVDVLLGSKDNTPVVLTQVVRRPAGAVGEENVT